MATAKAGSRLAYHRNDRPIEKARRGLEMCDDDQRFTPEGEMRADCGHVAVDDDLPRIHYAPPERHPTTSAARTHRERGRRLGSSPRGTR